MRLVFLCGGAAEITGGIRAVSMPSHPLRDGLDGYCSITLTACTRSVLYN